MCYASNRVLLNAVVTLQSLKMQWPLPQVIYRISCTIQLLLFFFIGVVMIECASPSYGGMSPSCQTFDAEIPTELTGLSNMSGVQYYTGEEAKVQTLCNKQFELPVTAIVLIAILNDGVRVTTASRLHSFTLH